MLTIRSEQMRAFEQSMEARLIDDLMAHLRRFHRECVDPIPLEDLRRQVSERVAKARAYGMTGRAAITAFAALSFAVGPRFDSQRMIHGVLTDPAVTPDDRMQQLHFRVRPLEWSEAVRL
jgi:hypothetical protein